MVMAAEANAGVLSGFLDYLRIEKGLAVLSINAYATDLLQFAAFLEKKRRLLMTARRTDVREFLQQLFSHQVDGRSVGRKLSALRHLYRYLLLDKKIEQDPTLNIESPRQWKVTLAEVAGARRRLESTLASPAAQLANGRRASQDATALAARDRAMLELLYAGALRVSELVNSTLEDLKLDAGYMHGTRQGETKNASSRWASRRRTRLRNISGRGGRPALIKEARVENLQIPRAQSVRSVGNPSETTKVGDSHVFIASRRAQKLTLGQRDLADGGGGRRPLPGRHCVAPHVATFLRYAYGGKMASRSAHGTDAVDWVTQTFRPRRCIPIWALDRVRKRHQKHHPRSKAEIKKLLMADALDC